MLNLAIYDDMATHMKTTMVLSDPLLEEARRVAATEGTTLRALVEEGLRLVLGERKNTKAFRLRDGRFGGRGLSPDLAEGTWDRISDLAYQGRGGSGA